MFKDITLHLVTVSALGISRLDRIYWNEALRPLIGKSVYIVSMYALSVSPPERPGLLVLSTRDLSRICVADPLTCISQLLPSSIETEADAR